MIGLELEIVDQILNSCEDLLQSPHMSDEQKEKLLALNIQIVDDFSISHIPVTVRIPSRIIYKGIDDFLEKLTRLTAKGVSKKAYKKIGILTVPTGGEGESLILLIAASIIEPGFQNFSESDLQQIIMDDDEPLREDDQDWI